MTSRFSIYPITISSQELVNYHKLSSGRNILPVTVPTAEQILLHRLLTAKNIYPVTISSSEIISLHRLAPGNINISTEYKNNRTCKKNMRNDKCFQINSHHIVNDGKR